MEQTAEPVAPPINNRDSQLAEDYGLINTVRHPTAYVLDNGRLIALS